MITPILHYANPCSPTPPPPPAPPPLFQTPYSGKKGELFFLGLPDHLRSLLRLGLERLLPITAYHDDGQEAADDGGEEDDEDDGDANGPDAGQE